MFRYFKYFCCVALVFCLAAAYVLWSPEEQQAVEYVRFFAPPENGDVRLAEVDDRALFEYRAELTFSKGALVGEPAGTVFSLELPELHCAAGFVNAQQSRVYTNQNDLEFWCKDLTREEQPLSFASIGHFRPEATQSSLANVRGGLFDDRSQALYSFSQERWTPLNTAERKLTQNGYILSIQHRANKTYVIYYNGKNNPGISIASQDGYHGTITHKDYLSFSAIYTDGESVYANLGHKLYVGTLFSGKEYTGPEPISLSVIDAGPNWLYTLFPYNGALIYGGSDGKAALHVLRSNNRLEHGRPFPEGYLPITEIYSMSAMNDMLLVGTYADGRVLSLNNEDGVLAWTPYASIDMMSRRNPGAGHRRAVDYESQAVVTSYGNVFTGMYPWGKLHAYDVALDREKEYRFFNQPDFAPYTYPVQTELEEPFLDLAASRFGTRYASIFDMPRQDVATLRAEGRWYGKWHQRVPSVVILDGRICVATGNLGGELYLPDFDTMLSQEQVAEYGKVYCAELPNQMLISAPEALEAGSYAFRIGEKHLAIVKDGKLLQSVPHNLSPESLRTLQETKNLSVTSGKGLYGVFNGELRLENVPLLEPIQ